MPVGEGASTPAQSPILEKQAVSCVPVGKGGGYLEKQRKVHLSGGAPQGRQGCAPQEQAWLPFMAPPKGSSDALSSSQVLQAQLVSKARGRVPSPTARSWWLVGSLKIQLGLV